MPLPKIVKQCQDNCLFPGLRNVLVNITQYPVCEGRLTVKQTRVAPENHGKIGG